MKSQPTVKEFKNKIGLKYFAKETLQARIAAKTAQINHFLGLDGFNGLLGALIRERSELKLQLKRVRASK